MIYGSGLHMCSILQVKLMTNTDIDAIVAVELVSTEDLLDDNDATETISSSVPGTDPGFQKGQLQLQSSANNSAARRQMQLRLN